MIPTRETFGNIPHASVIVFYCLTVVTMAVFANGVWRRFRLWRQGVPISVRRTHRRKPQSRSGTNCDRALDGYWRKGWGRRACAGEGCRVGRISGCLLASWCCCSARHCWKSTTWLRESHRRSNSTREPTTSFTSSRSMFLDCCSWPGACCSFGVARGVHPASAIGPRTGM